MSQMSYACLITVSVAGAALFNHTDSSAIGMVANMQMALKHVCVEAH